MKFRVKEPSLLPVRVILLFKRGYHLSPSVPGLPLLLLPSLECFYIFSFYVSFAPIHQLLPRRRLKTRNFMLILQALLSKLFLWNLLHHRHTQQVQDDRLLRRLCDRVAEIVVTFLLLEASIICVDFLFLSLATLYCFVCCFSSSAFRLCHIALR